MSVCVSFFATRELERKMPRLSRARTRFGRNISGILIGFETFFNDQKSGNDC